MRNHNRQHQRVKNGALIFKETQLWRSFELFHSKPIFMRIFRPDLWEQWFQAFSLENVESLLNT